jgi:hypothetical protein
MRILLMVKIQAEQATAGDGPVLLMRLHQSRRIEARIEVASVADGVPLSIR